MTKRVHERLTWLGLLADAQAVAVRDGDLPLDVWARTYERLCRLCREAGVPVRTLYGPPRASASAPCPEPRMGRRRAQARS